MRPLKNLLWELLELIVGFLVKFGYFLKLTCDFVTEWVEILVLGSKSNEEQEKGLRYDPQQRFHGNVSLSRKFTQDVPNFGMFRSNSPIRMKLHSADGEGSAESENPNPRFFRTTVPEICPKF
jgi:hypothetical protein